MFLIILINIYGYSLYMDDIWIISWFNHTAFDANPIWKSPICFVCHSCGSSNGPKLADRITEGSAKRSHRTLLSARLDETWIFT